MPIKKKPTPDTKGKAPRSAPKFAKHDRPYTSKDSPKRATGGPRKDAEAPRQRRYNDDKPTTRRGGGNSKPFAPKTGSDSRPYAKTEGEGDKPAKNKKIFSRGPVGKKPSSSNKPRFNKGSNRPTMGRSRTADEPRTPRFSLDEPMRLNKYMAHAGIASRRAADAIIANGEVTVNDKVVREMGYKVQPNDVVRYDGKRVKPVGKMVYILLNKPKDYITSTADEKDRRTVMDLVAQATEERIYPVGRLDRQTTGLLLLTNDGELTQKMSHPSHKLKKIYHVTLDKPITEAQLEAVANGLVLEDGVAEVDIVAFADKTDKTQVGIELHIGKNRIVRRIFEHLGFEVTKLDRVYYGGLTKKDLPRGRWRFLTEQEIVMLKHFTGRGR